MSLVRRLDQAAGLFFLSITAAAAIVAITSIGGALPPGPAGANAEAAPAGPHGVTVSDVVFAPKPREG